MAVNYAQKFDQKVDERFAREALSNAVVNQDFDFTDVDTVKVYSIPTTQMNDYQTSGASRYGTPEELGNTVQTMVLTKDRSFTFTIDKRSAQDTNGTMEAGKALARQLNEVVIPEIDKYRFAKICASADPTHIATAAITKENAYESVLDAQVKLTDAFVPTTGRVLHVSPNFYKLIKLDPSFIKSSDLAQDMLIKGQVGQIDGLPVVLTPTSYLPENVVKTDLVELQGKITAIEQREHDVNQELLDVGQKQAEMTKRIETLESREDNDTIYDDTEIKQSIANVDNKISGLSEKVTALEERPIVDTALTERVEALECKEDKDTVYDDTPIIKRIETLEDKPDNDTIYDDSNLKAQIAELQTALNTLVRKRPPMSFYIDRSDMSKMKAVFDNGCVMINFAGAVYNYFYGYPGGHDGRSFHYYNLPGNLIKVSVGIVGVDSLKEESISNAIYYCNDTKILNPIYDSSQFNFDELVIREPTDKIDYKLACQRNFVKIAYEIGALTESEIIKLGATKK